jgi:hypothetical protein
MWALRQLTREEFEVSVAPVEGSNTWRRALEALLRRGWSQADADGDASVIFRRIAS